MSTFNNFIQAIDVLHRGGLSGPRLVKRELTGRIFGAELPAYVIFHAMLGYVILAVGLIAIILRLPFKAIRRVRWLHQYVGLAWVLLTIYMPVTAIWCVYVHPDWDVVAFFIFSMYITIGLGWVFIRIWKSKTGTDRLPSQEVIPSKGAGILKWMHGGFMIYSVIMLLGAGISFPFRANSDYAVGGRLGPPARA